MIGQTLLHYRITDRLGAGAMGEVCRARDEKLNRDVAVKVLPERRSPTTRPASEHPRGRRPPVRGGRSQLDKAPPMSRRFLDCRTAGRRITRS